MKCFRLTVLFLSLAACLCLWCNAADETFSAPDGSYQLAFTENADGTLTLSSCSKGNGEATNVSIPAEVNGKAVAVIGKEAFYQCTYTGTLTIPEGIRVIEAYAFRSAKFTGTLTLPDNLTTLNSNAFASCTGLSGDLKIPGTVKNIASSAFSSCSKLASITLGEGVETIGEYAFSGCTAASGALCLPSTLQKIGANAFYGCKALTEMTLPSGLAEIGDKAFYQCTGLSGDLVIPGGVVSVGKQAFYQCTGLTGAITLNDGVEHIGDQAFYNCYNAAGALTLPSTLKSVGANAFYYCQKLTGDLTLGKNLTTIGASAFSYCNNLSGHLVIPDSVTSLGQGAFTSCSGLTGVTLPKGLTSISASLFHNCSGLTGELILPENLTSIGSYAFFSCSGLTGQLCIPHSVTEIGSYAFYGCTGFSGTLILPQDLQVLGEQSLCSLTGMRGNVQWPEGLTYLGNQALPVCKEIVFSPDFPDSVTYIGSKNFYQSESLSGQLHLPASLTEIGDYAFGYCEGLHGSLVIPDGLTTIGKQAFMFCTGLSGDLILPPGVTSVKVSAFGGCDGFSGTLKLPYGITIGNGAFSRVFDTVWIPASLSYQSVMYAFDAGKNFTAMYYYGGTKDYLENTLGYTSYRNYEYILYESYPALDLTISNGEPVNCLVGEDFTLTAQYYNSQELADITFVWSSSDTSLFRLSEPENNAAANGFSAKPSVTVTPLAAGTGTITVTGPAGLSDTITVTVSDRKILSFRPAEKQSATEPNPIPLNKSISLTFRYETAGNAADEWQEIQWKVLSGGDGLSEVTLGTAQAVIVDTHTADVTASVTGTVEGTPVTVTLTGPGGCTAAVQVVVTGDKILFLNEDKTVPADDEKAMYSVSTGDQFQIFLQYETQAEAQVVETLFGSMKWIQSTEDFMIHPDDLAANAGDAVHRNSTVADPVKVEYNLVKDGVYQIEATIAAALEGACGLKVQIGDYVTDTCAVLSAFDSERYLAYLLQDTRITTSVDAYALLRGETPATAILDVLQEQDGYLGASFFWQKMKAVFDALEKPSSIYDLSVKEEDLYYGMLLEILSDSVQEHKNAAILNTVKFGTDVATSITDCHKMLKGLNSELPSLDLYLDTFELDQLAELYESKHTVIKNISSVTNRVDQFSSTAKGAGELIDRFSASIMLKGISDANLALLKQMLVECDNYENTDALEKALEKCIAQVEESCSDGIVSIMAGSAAANGVKAVGTLVDNWWGKLIDKVKVSHPVAAMVYTGYHSGTTLSNLLYSTDATLEEYYRMAAMQDIKTVARAAHNTLSENWDDDPAAYLAAFKALFHIHLLDCDYALQYADTLDDALRSKVKEAWGDTDFDTAEAAFTSYRNNIETMYYAYQVLWLDYVDTDYPGVLLNDTYESVFADILPVERKVFFACPVEIHVMDGEEEVACISNDSIYTSTDDITVALDGDQKGVIFLNGAEYTLRIVGTDEGTMDVTDICYSDGVPSRRLEYNDLPVVAQGEYLSKRFHVLLDDDGDSVQADCDSQDSAEYTLSVISGQADVSSVRAGQNVSVLAVVPEGYIFAGWLCDHEEAVLEDPSDPVTTLRMPAGNVTLTAQLKVLETPEDRLTLTDEEGFVLREIPETTFSLQVTCGTTGFLAAYDADGKMLSVQIPVSVEGVAAAQLDNTEGAIARIALFRVANLQNPVPEGPVLEITAN